MLFGKFVLPPGLRFIRIIGNSFEFSLETGIESKDFNKSRNTNNTGFHRLFMPQIY